MDISFNEINYLKDPDSLTLKADYKQFLLSLTGPTVIDITGRNTSIYRVVTTLLHGNEPSGLIALHRWLTSEGEIPVAETNIRFIICSVEAASYSPMFSYRYLPDGLDINRCFGSDHNHQYYQRAKLIEKSISDVSPDATFCHAASCNRMNIFERLALDIADFKSPAIKCFLESLSRNMVSKIPTCPI